MSKPTLFTIVCLLCLLFGAIVAGEPADSANSAVEQYDNKTEEFKKLCAKEYWNLARWCKMNALYEEAQTHFKQVMEYGPENQEAKK